MIEKESILQLTELRVLSEIKNDLNENLFY